MALAYGTAKDRKKALKCMKVRGVVIGLDSGLGVFRLRLNQSEGMSTDLPVPAHILRVNPVLSMSKPSSGLQGHVGAMARDEWGHLTLITALSVVDDTTLLRKSIVAELQVRSAALLFLDAPSFLQL